MQRIRVALFACVIALLTALPSAAQSASAPAAPVRLTLADAMARAATGNRALAAARLKQAADAAGVDVAAERENPEFAYEADRDFPHQAFSLTFPIETGGKRARRIDVAKATVGVTVATIAQTALDITMNIRRAYFTLAAAQARAEIAGQIRDLAKRASDAATTRVALGDVPRLEQLQAELELAAAENDASRARADALSARAGLNVLIGLPPATEVVALDDVLIAPPLAGITASGGGQAPVVGVTLPPASPTAPPNFAAALSLTPAPDSVDLAVIDREIAAAQARRNLAQAMTVPDFGAGGTLTSGVPDEFAVGWRLSGTVTVPLFTRHRAGILVEDAALAQLRGEREALVAELTGKIVDAAARATAAADALRRFTDDILPRSKEIEAMAQDSYQSGQTGLVALLQTLQSARNLRLQSVQAGLDMQLALADLERALGASIK